MTRRIFSLCVRGLEESHQSSSTLSNGTTRRRRSSSILENQEFSSKSISTNSLLVGMTVGKHAWKQEEDQKEDISTALIFQELLFTSELFKDTQDVMRSENQSWWADSMECYTYLRNVTDLLSDGKTPYERRFGKPFEGPIIPFGSLVEYHPVIAKDQSIIHQFGKKVSPGLFLGYALYAEEFGRVTYWSQTLRSWRRWTHRKSTQKAQCERGDISQTRRIYFSNRRWTNQTPWRRSGTENIHLDTAATSSRNSFLTSTALV